MRAIWEPAYPVSKVRWKYFKIGQVSTKVWWYEWELYWPGWGKWFAWQTLYTWWWQLQSPPVHLVVHQVETAHFGTVKYNLKASEEVGVEEKQEDLGGFLKQLRRRRGHHNRRKGLSTADCSNYKRWSQRSKYMNLLIFQCLFQFFAQNAWLVGGFQRRKVVLRNKLDGTFFDKWRHPTKWLVEEYLLLD